MNISRLALGLVLGLVLGLGLDARAQDDEAPSPTPTPGPAAEVHVREYPKLKFKIEVPKAWRESQTASRLKWEVEGQAASCELTWWDERKDLDQVEKNLRGTADTKKWTLVEPPSRMKVDDNAAFYMLADIPSETAGEPDVRQLFVVIDAPQGTFLLTYGDIAGKFDRELIDKVVRSFKRHDGEATASGAGGGAAAGEEWGCKACAKTWPTTLKFCGDCGAKNVPLVPEKKLFGCATCKKEWPETLKFCGDCGAKTGPY